MENNNNNNDNNVVVSHLDHRSSEFFSAGEIGGAHRSQLDAIRPFRVLEEVDGAVEGVSVLARLHGQILPIG